MPRVGTKLKATLPCSIFSNRNCCLLHILKVKERHFYLTDFNSVTSDLHLGVSATKIFETAI